METPVFIALRKCGYWILNGDTGPAIEALKKLNSVPQAVPFATQALVRLYVQNQEWKQAESVILESIRLHPRLPSLIHTVASFYVDARMPAQALRFYIKLKNICNNCETFSFDIAQAALALGQIDVAMEALTQWNRVHPGSEAVTQYIAKLCMADGNDSQLDKLFSMNKSQVKRMQEIWEKYENSGTTSVQQNAS